MTQNSMQNFPVDALAHALSDSSQLQKKIKPFLNEFKQKNMFFIHNCTMAFYKILTNKTQSPILKFNTLLAIKLSFDTGEYAVITLIEVYLLPIIFQIALFRSQIQDQSMLVTYFSSKGYRQAQIKDLKKISFNFMILALEFMFMSCKIKKFRTVQNIQLKEQSNFTKLRRKLQQSRVKQLQKFSFFLPDYQKKYRANYLQKLQEHHQDSQPYSQYFLTIILQELNSNKKSIIEAKKLLQFGDVYLTSSMIQICEDELQDILQKFQFKKKYLVLFNQFVRWGDIQAVMLVNNSDFITNIAINVCNVRGDININQGENIYPEITGKKVQKKQFYIQFLRCIQTWADCIPVNEQNLQSNVRRIFIFLKEEKKFKFPESLVLKRYKKEMEDNLKNNLQRNQKILELNQYISSGEGEGTKLKSQNSLKNEKSSVLAPKNKKAVLKLSTLEKIVNQMKSILLTLTDKQKQIEGKFKKLANFKQSWVGYLDGLNLDDDSFDDELIQVVILQGDQCMQQTHLVTPLINAYLNKNLTFQELKKRIDQNLHIHNQLSMSRSINLTKSKNITISNHNISNLAKSLNVSNLTASHRKNKIHNHIKKIKQLQKSKFSKMQISQAKLPADQRELRITNKKSQISEVRNSHNQIDYYGQKSQNFKPQQQNSDYFQEKQIKQSQLRSSVSKSKSRISLKQKLQGQKAKITSKLQERRQQKQQTIVSNSSQAELTQQSNQLRQDMKLDHNTKVVVQFSDVDQYQFFQREKQKQRMRQESQNRKKIKSIKKVQTSERSIHKSQRSDRSKDKYHNEDSKKIQTKKMLRDQYGDVFKNLQQKHKQEDRQKTPKRQNHKRQKSSNRIQLQKKQQLDVEQGHFQQIFRKIEKIDHPAPEVKATQPSNKKSNTKPLQFQSQDSNIFKKHLKEYNRQVSQKSSRQNSISKRNETSQGKNVKRGGISVTQHKPTVSDEYNHLPQKFNKLIQLQQVDSDLYKTKKISQSNQNFKLRLEQVHQTSKNSIIFQDNHQFIQEKQERYFRRRPIFQQRSRLSILKEQTDGISSIKKSQSKIQNSVLSIDLKPKKSGISLSLGKRQSILKKNKESILKNNSIIKVDKKGNQNKLKKIDDDYFGKEPRIEDKKEQKLSNLVKMKKKIQLNEDDQDLIRSPDSKPMIQSHYKTQQIQRKLHQKIEKQSKLQFKNIINQVSKMQTLTPKSKQIQKIISAQNLIKNNPYSKQASKSNSSEKFFNQNTNTMTNFIFEKDKNKQFYELQKKVQLLEVQSKSMKTKLAIKEAQIKSYKNFSERGDGNIQFSNPSESNYYLSSDGFKTNSKACSDKNSYNPSSCKHFYSQKQISQGSPVKLVKSTPYRKYLDKIQGSTMKKTLLKTKSLIKKQEQIQIGCMSNKKQDFSIQITLFLTPLRFDLTDFFYQILTDQNIQKSSYTSSDTSKGIQAKKQMKIYINMKIKNIPFYVPQVKFSYRSKSQYATNTFKLVIPVLFNKFCQFQQLPSNFYENKSVELQKLMMTSEFKLNSKVIKLQKIKQLLPSFSCIKKQKQLSVYSSAAIYKKNFYIIILKINQKNHVIIQGVLQQGDDTQSLQFLMVSLKCILETDNTK